MSSNKKLIIGNEFKDQIVVIIIITILIMVETGINFDNEIMSTYYFLEWQKVNLPFKSTALFVNSCCVKYILSDIAWSKHVLQEMTYSVIMKVHVLLFRFI